MATVTARRRGDTLAHDIEIGDHSLVSDEPPASGGTDSGPSPTRLLAASLASCTAITVEMYADRKGWELPGLLVAVDIAGDVVQGTAVYEVTLQLPADLEEEQVERLVTIAGKCPVHKAMAGETEITIEHRIGD